MTVELLSDLLIVCSLFISQTGSFFRSEIFHSVFPAKTKGSLQKKKPKTTFHKVCLTPEIVPSEFIIHISTICFH